MDPYEHTASDDLIASHAYERIESDEVLRQHQDYIFAVPNDRTWAEHMTWICEAPTDELLAYATLIESHL